MKSKQTFVRKSTRRISLFIFFVTAVGQFVYSQDPTISGEITYPSNQFDYPSGKLFIPVWKNPSTWPFPPENEYPITEEIIVAPDLNYPVNYTVEVTGVAPGDFYYVAVFFDEDTAMQPQEPEAEAWYPDGFELDVASAENVNMALGPIGGGGFSFDFGATGGYAETNFNTLDGGPEITMEMFINLHSTTGFGLYEFIHREEWGFLDYVSDGTIRFSLFNIGEINWQFSPNTGEWHHIAADYDGVNMAIYWDGELKASVPASGNLPSSSNLMRFGENFDGLADIIRISDIALYQGNNFDPWTQDYNPTSNTRLLYNCNEGSGNQLIDDSGEGYNATITGNPTWDPNEPLGPAGSSLWISGSDINYIDLSWDRWPDADGDFVRYELHRNTVGGVTLGDPVILDETDVNVLNWRDNNVSEGNNYYYKLWMYDQGGIRYETNEVSATPGAAGGHVDGNIHSDESASGELIIGLFSPDNGGDDWNPWDPDFQQNWSATFPSDQGYQFDDPGIWDGFGWEVRAFVDENSDWNPNPEELLGVSGEFEVTGGSAANINFDLYFGGGGNGRIDFTIESPLSTVSGNIYMGVYYDGNPDTGQPDVSLGPYWHNFNSGNYSDFIDGIVEGDDYAVATFFDRDGSPNGGPDICDAGQDMSARIYNVDVWGTNNIGTLMLADCGGGSDQVTVTYPNGGETFTEGDQITITWDWIGGSIGLDILLSQNSGGNYDYYIGSASATDESYSWTIPNDVASANCRIAIEDSAVPSTFDESDGDFNILDAGGALGEFTTDHQHLYWVAEEGSQDTAAVLFSNVGSGELQVENVNSSNPASLYPAGNVSFPIVVNPGETEAVVMIIDPSVGPGTWNGTINFDLGNAASNSASIDFTVEVFVADSVEITTGTINNAASGLYDLIDEVSMSINFSSVSVSGEGVLINYVDGILPLNPAGDQGMAIADRFWEIISSLEDGEFSADLCFDLSELEGIADFSALKIIKRSVYSDGTWSEISGGDLVYDEINNIICADNQTSFSQWTVGSDSSGTNFLPQLEVSATQLNFEFGVSDQEFNVGNSGVGTLYWNINVGYLSGDNWLNLSSESGDAANSNEDTIVVSVVPTGSEEDAQILVNGYTDSDMTDLVDTDTVMVHLDAPAAPEILSISGDTEAFVAQPFNITAVIRAEAALDTVELRYIIGGETDIRSVGFNFLSGETWGVQVPDNHVRNSGFFYFVAAKDVYEKETTSNPAEVRVGFAALNVHQTSPETYSMFSVPGDLSLGSRNIEEQFGDELGSVDPEQWRIFRWKNGQYVENSGELKPGSGFWIITREAVILQTKGGKSTQLFGGTAIALESGWNMVGNPYAFDIDMSDVEAEGGAIEPALYEYNGGGYNTVSTLKAGRGYWLYANSNTTITVKPLGAGSVSRIASEELSWHGSVSVASGDLVDGENVFGAAANASTDWDALDRHEPPVIGDYVTLAFDNDDWTSQPGRYSRDIRNSSESGHVWSLSVITNRSGYVILSVEIPVELPAGWELYLVDNTYRMVQNLSVETEYEFTSNGSETPRKFEIIAGPPEFTREVMSDLELIPSDYRLAQNVPNPFNAITTIQFSLPEENNVSLTIYDLVGRKVAEPLSNEPYGSGGHFMIWNGKDSQGQPVSSGVYLYRLKATKNGETEFTKTKKLILLK